jgi:hypothetical protein
MPSTKEHSAKHDAKRVMAGIRDLYLSIGLLFAAGLKGICTSALS